MDSGLNPVCLESLQTVPQYRVLIKPFVVDQPRRTEVLYQHMVRNPANTLALSTNNRNRGRYLLLKLAGTE